jgi:small subunit ribosomal protein S11
MLKLKEFYQYKRELKKNNFPFKNRLLVNPSIKNFPIKGDSSLSKGCQAILYVKSSRSNTIVSLTNLKGKVQYIQSCGSMGFKGKKKRSTKFAVESTLYSIVEKAKEQGHKSVFIHLNGFARARFAVLSCLKKNDLKIEGIRDLTPNPHNGCRPRKARRI